MTFWQHDARFSAGSGTILLPETPGQPDPVPPPMTPPAPIGEPDPDRLPDEAPVPNPDENDNPPQSV